MTPITIYPSRWKAACWLFIGTTLVFIFAAILLFTKSRTLTDWMYCVTAIVFFGFSSGVVPLLKIVKHRPLYIIDDVGVHNLIYRIVVPWSEIAGLYLRRVQSADFIYLELNNPEKWWSRSKFTAARPWVKKIRQLEGVTERTGAALSLLDASVSTTRVVKAIQEMIDLHSSESVNVAQAPDRPNVHRDNENESPKG